jgi:hypothetical protein
MTEPTVTIPEAPAAVEVPPAAPWERDGTPFDPARAWSLVQSVRADLDKTRADRDGLKTNVETYRQAQLTKEQQLEERVATAESGRVAAVAESLRLRVAAEYGLSAVDLPLLGQGAEAELRANAKRLAELTLAAAQQHGPPTPQRPVENLRPGATPTDQPSDDDVLWAKLFGTDRK